MENFFVTGGAGFIGSAFIRSLLESRPNARVTTFDALTYAGSESNLSDIQNDAGLAARHRFVRGDIRNADDVLKALPMDCEAIFNFAAESHVDRSILTANDFITTNVLGTQVLLDCARKNRVRKFVQISTDEVMGSLQEGNESLFTEDSPFAPNSPYAASKAAAEHFVRAAHETFGLDYLITRSGNNYGPRQYPEKLIPVIITKAFNDEQVPIYGDGKNIRDWIHVDDHCDAILTAYEHGRSNCVYNIGARNLKSNLEVVETILDSIGKPHSLISFVSDRPGHDRKYAIDPTKIERELGWEAKRDWTGGIEETVKWYRDNLDFINRY